MPNLSREQIKAILADPDEAEPQTPAFLQNHKRSSDPHATKRLSPSNEQAFDAAWNRVWNKKNERWIETGLFVRTGDRVTHKR